MYWYLNLLSFSGKILFVQPFSFLTYPWQHIISVIEKPSIKERWWEGFFHSVLKLNKLSLQWSVFLSEVSGMETVDR